MTKEERHKVGGGASSMFTEYYNGKRINTCKCGCIDANEACRMEIS
jgi:hypothetical protein